MLGFLLLTGFRLALVTLDLSVVLLVDLMSLDPKIEAIIRLSKEGVDDFLAAGLGFLLAGFFERPVPDRASAGWVGAVTAFVVGASSLTTDTAAVSLTAGRKSMSVSATSSSTSGEML